MNAASLLRIALATIVALGLAAAAIGITLAQQRLDEGDFASAARLSPLSADARAAEAAALLIDERYQQAAATARSALDRSPLTPDALSIIAYLAERRGDSAAAAELMSLSARLSWANEPAQLWMLGRAAEAGRVEEAVVRTDALLRQRLRREELFAFLRGYLVEPGAVDAVAERIASGPRWRGDFMQALGNLPREGFDAHRALLQRLKATSSPPTREDIAAFVARLVAERQYAEARATWSDMTGLARNQLLADGDFAQPRRGDAAPFEWRIDPEASLSMRNVPGPPAALQLLSEGRPSGRALRQTIVLDPGRYSINMLARDNEPGSLQSLTWEISCLGGAGKAAATPIEARPGAAGWLQAQSTLSVPPDCRAQLLTLRVDHDRAVDLDLLLRGAAIRPAG